MKLPVIVQRLANRITSAGPGNREIKLAGLVFLATAYFAFQGLGNNLFWGDEGSTALAAKSFLRHGKVAGWEVPWDGHNYNTAY
ncbi:MAG: hypothetical protein GF410_07610, partial [Chitinivibrionales bacterium]|nr:hypothetical protein [Chitinivibrionales bacterium]